MRIVLRLIISYILLVVAISLSFAQSEDETIFPPITPENRSQASMIQALSQGDPLELAWSPNGDRLALTASGGTWIYNLDEPHIPRHHIKGHDLIASVQFAPHDDIYISYTSLCPMGICEDGQRAYIHDAQTDEILHEIRMNHISAYFIRDGEYLALSSYSHGIVIWRTDSFKKNIGRHPSEFYQCQIRTQAPVSYVQFSDDEKLVTYGGWRQQMMSSGDGSVWFWDTETCDVQLEVKAYEDDGYTPVYANARAYSPNGQYAVIPYYIEAERRLFYGLWDVHSRQFLGDLPDTLSMGLLWGFTPDNQHLLFHDENTGMARIWNIETQTFTRAFYARNIIKFDDTSLLILRGGNLYRITITEETLLFDDEDYITDVFMTDDKTWLILRYGNHGTKIMDVATQTVIYEWAHHVSPSISPDKSKIAWIEDGYIATVNIGTGEVLDIPYFQNVGNHIHWSDTDNTMVTYTQAGDDYPFSYYYDASDDPIFIVWTLTENGFEYRWSKTDDYAQLIHAGDDYILLMNGGTVEFWDTQTGELVETVPANTCDQTEPFCARWLAVRPDESSSPIITSVQRDDAVFSFDHPNLPTGVQSYTIPDHIITQLDADDTTITWQLADNGDILAQFGRHVYNITQDTAMQMGRVTTLATCRTPANCDSFLIENIWLSREGSRLFGSGWAAHYTFLDHTQTVLTAWDVASGRRLYNVYGDTYDEIRLSDDEEYVFLYGNEFYYGMGKTYYNRYAEVYDAHTGDALKFVSTYGGNAYDIDVSPNRRFIVVHSDNNRVWAITQAQGD